MFRSMKTRILIYLLIVLALVAGVPATSQALNRYSPFFYKLLATPKSIGSGTITAISIYNPNGSTEYVQFFDSPSGTTPTVGTTAPVKVIAIPATSTYTSPGDEVSAAGTLFWVAATTTDSGSTAPGTALDFNCDYQH